MGEKVFTIHNCGRESETDWLLGVKNAFVMDMGTLATVPLVRATGKTLVGI